MSGYLTRLAEKAVGAGPALVPLIAPLYGNAPRMGSVLPGEADGLTNSESGLLKEMIELPQTLTGETRVPTQADHETPRAPFRSVRALNERQENLKPREQVGAPHSRALVERPVQPSTPFVKPLHDSSAARHSEVQPILPASSVRHPETHTAQSVLRDPAEGEAEHAAPRTSHRDARPTQPTAHLDSVRERGAFHRSAREISEATTRLDKMLARLRALSTPAESARDPVAHTPAPPVVRVSIGRIEVRAAPAPYVAPPPVREERKPTGPTLAEYLAKRPRVTP